MTADARGQIGFVLARAHSLRIARIDRDGHLGRHRQAIVTVAASLDGVDAGARARRATTASTSRHLPKRDGVGHHTAASINPTRLLTRRSSIARH